MIRSRCPVPSRWALDELAHAFVLAAAERELAAARLALEYVRGPLAGGEALDRYVVALEARNAVRGGRL